MTELSAPELRQSLPYRPCVGMMVLNAQGLVWAGRRLSAGNSESDGTPQLWQMPQGGIDEGEDPLQAALRELYEETGMRSVSLLARASEPVFYELPDHLLGTGLRGRFRGQVQQWFAFRFTGEEGEIAIDPPPDGHQREFDAWAWLPMDQLPAMVVEFKRKAYEQVVQAFSHLVRD